MSSAIGSSTAAAAARPSQGEIWVDVRDYGAKGDGGITDNAGPFQAAVDALAAKLQSSPAAANSVGVVHIPTALFNYVVSRPVYVDFSNIEIRGDGWGSQVSLPGNSKHSVFVFGVHRTEYTITGPRTPLTIDAAHRPDLNGILDSSAVSGPGQLWGLRTNANSFVQIQASPMSAGVQSSAGYPCWDYWTQTPQLTVEFCIAPPPGQSLPLNAPILGCGFDFYFPSPFTFAMRGTPNQIYVSFRTADIPAAYNAGARVFSFSVAGATAPYRIAVQFDLVNAVCTAFVNGVQVALTNLTNLAPASTPPFVANSGLQFQQNDYFPMMIGADNSRLSGNSNGTTAIDLSVYGLRLSNTIRYQNNGAGTAQRRADSPGSAINDRYAYFTNDANTIAYLALTDNPATATRMVTVQHGNTTVGGGAGSGFFLHGSNSGWTIYNAIRDIQITAGNGFGQAITVGNVIEMTLDNVRAINGFHGVGALNWGANYNIYVRNCNLSGSDAGYYGYMQLISASDIFFDNSGRATVRMVGCNSSWRNVFVSGAANNAECYFKMHSYEYGGNHYITNVLADFEGYSLALAAFYCEAHGLTPATSLVLKDVYLGTVAQGASLVMVKDYGNTPAGEYRNCWLSVENLQAFTTTYLAAVDVDGPLWHGEVKGVALSGPQFNHRQKWGTTTHVLIRDTKYTGPPRQFPWYSGAHALEVRSPSDGQFSEWRCMASGTYGTATAPKWVGLGPLQLTPNGLAAYVLNQGYITAALN